MILNKSSLKKLLLLSRDYYNVVTESVYFNVLRSCRTIIILNAKNAQEDNS